MDQTSLTFKFSPGSKTHWWRLTLELRRPDAESRDVLTPGEGVRLRLNPQDLESCRDIAEYGRKLSERLFSSVEARVGLERARNVHAGPFRIRVSVPELSPLNSVRWELLGDPDKQAKWAPLSRGKRSSVARFIAPGRSAPNPTNLNRGLRAVALVANPRSLDGDLLELDEIDVATEASAISECMYSTRIRLLTGPGKATAAKLRAELAQGCDILYLVCHGQMDGDKAYLYLENDGGQADLFPAADLASALRDLPVSRLPRLAVFASCQSVGVASHSFNGGAGFLNSAAMHLIDAGVPAVIGMQGDITQKSSRSFFLQFFKDVLATGSIEEAVSAARVSIVDEDWWMPVLLLASEAGQLWPSGMRPEFQQWEQLKKDLQNGDCTPILGSELAGEFSNRNLAAYLRQKLKYPLLARGHDELPHIAQLLKTEKYETKPSEEMENFYLRTLEEEGVTPGREHTNTVNLLSSWRKMRSRRGQFDAHGELAQLRIPVFITANPDDLLIDALREHEKIAQPIVCPWKRSLKDVHQLPDTLEPSEKQPIVYHLFGHLADKHSIAITEDDFFDYLIWISENSGLIPPKIVTRFATSSLLFIGFRLDDWEFRVLLRTIAKLGGSEMLAGRPHIAVQLDPSEMNEEQQRDAMQALEEFFRKTHVAMDIYWGTVEDFLSALKRRAPSLFVPNSVVVGD